MDPIVDEEESTISALLDSWENRDFWCVSCKHKTGLSTCNAFPEQIPSPILTGTMRHTKREFDQDNDIFFEHA